jgi:hypothetical protein
MTFPDVKGEPSSPTSEGTPDAASRFVKDQLNKYIKSYRRYARAWSLCFYGFTFGAAALSATAGLLPQIYSNAKNIASLLAVMSSLFTTLIALGRFQEKWRASRLARSAVEQLQIDFGVGRDVNEIADQLKSAIGAQHVGVIGAREEPVQN